MNIRLTLNTRRLARFNGQIETAQRWLDNEVLKDCEPYVPMDTGTLARSGQRGTAIGSGEIVYNAPYAAAQYYGRAKKAKDKHPQAAAQWFEKAKAVHGARWVAAAKELAGGGKG